MKVYYKIIIILTHFRTHVVFHPSLKMSLIYCYMSQLSSCTTPGQNDRRRAFNPTQQEFLWDRENSEQLLYIQANLQKYKIGKNGTGKTKQRTICSRLLELEGLRLRTFNYDYMHMLAENCSREKTNSINVWFLSNKSNILLALNLIQLHLHHVLFFIIWM